MTDDTDTIEIDLTRVFRRKHLLDSEAQQSARFHGLTDVELRLDRGVGLGPDGIRFSRASTTGSFQNLDADEAREVAHDLREIEDRPLGYWLSGDRDNLSEMADALEAAADVLDASAMLDDEILSAARAKAHEVDQ